MNRYCSYIINNEIYYSNRKIKYSFKNKRNNIFKLKLNYLNYIIYKKLNYYNNRYTKKKIIKYKVNKYKFFNKKF